MADFERKLAMLAERGTRVGPEEMIERVEAQLAEDPLVVVTKQRKGWGMSVQTDEKRERKQGSTGRGLAWAAAVFVVVVGIAALLIALSGEPESEVVEPAPPTTVAVDIAAMAAVTDAYAALSAGDVDEYIDALAGEEQEGALTWRNQYEAGAVADLSIEFPNGCTYQGTGDEGNHLVECYAVTTSDFYEAAGIVEVGDDVFHLNSDLKIVGWDSGNETNDPGDFETEILRWLYAEYPDVADGMTAGPSNPWDKTPEDVAIMLEYAEEFVAQSDVYPLAP